MLQRAEFDNCEQASSSPHALLSEKDWTGRGQPNRDRNQEEKEDQQRRDGKNAGAVKEAF